MTIDTSTQAVEAPAVFIDFGYNSQGIAQLSIENDVGGYRIAGGKFDGGGRSAFKAPITARAAREIEHYLTQVPGFVPALLSERDAAIARAEAAEVREKALRNAARLVLMASTPLTNIRSGKRNLVAHRVSVSAMNELDRALEATS